MINAIQESISLLNHLHSDKIVYIEQALNRDEVWLGWSGTF